MDKVTNISYGANEDKILTSVGQDGNMIFWDVQKGMKIACAVLESTWALACATSPDGKSAVCGGMDDTLSFYTGAALTSNEMTPSKKRQSILSHHSSPEFTLNSHSGYISGLHYVDESTVISSSGDKSAIVWDIQKRTKVLQTEHPSDCLCVTGLKSNTNLFLTGCIDGTVKLWDIRTGKCEKVFAPRQGDINKIAVMNNDTTFGVACENDHAVICDLRTTAPLNSLELLTQGGSGAAKSIAFSSSGALTFVGFFCGSVVAYNTISKATIDKADFSACVSDIAMNSSGTALAVSSWNNTIRIYS
jgi:WD40 repeat protein